jgi:hypothetical protein
MLFFAIAISSFISAFVVVNASTLACRFVTVALKYKIIVINEYVAKYKLRYWNNHTKMITFESALNKLPGQ